MHPRLSRSKVPPSFLVPWCPGVLVSWCPGVLVSWCPFLSAFLLALARVLVRCHHRAEKTAIE